SHKSYRARYSPKGEKTLGLPLPVRKLFAEGDFLEFADGCTGDGVQEHEGVGQLPLGKRCSEEGPQLFGGGASPILQDDGGERAFLPFRMGNADDTRFFNGGGPHQSVFLLDSDVERVVGTNQILDAVY